MKKAGMNLITALLMIVLMASLTLFTIRPDAIRAQTIDLFEDDEAEAEEDEDDDDLLENSITVAETILVSYSEKAQKVSIGAKAANGKLSYESDSKKIKVSSSGVVTIPPKWTGSVNIDIEAEGDDDHDDAEATVTLYTPSSASISGVKAQKAMMTVKWKRASKASGYLVQYSLKKNFKGAKKVAINSASTNKTVVKKLKAGKTYYVRVCNAVKSGSKTYYGAWSKTKTVKIKK